MTISRWYNFYERFHGNRDTIILFSIKKLGLLWVMSLFTILSYEGLGYQLWFFSMHFYIILVVGGKIVSFLKQFIKCIFTNYYSKNVCLVYNACVKIEPAFHMVNDHSRIKTTQPIVI